MELQYERDISGGDGGPKRLRSAVERSASALREATLVTDRLHGIEAQSKMPEAACHGCGGLGVNGENDGAHVLAAGERCDENLFDFCHRSLLASPGLDISERDAMQDSRASGCGGQSRRERQRVIGFSERRLNQRWYVP